jgi:hypothetical protein
MKNSPEIEDEIYKKELAEYLDQKKQQLQNVLEKLINAGLTVQWSSHSEYDFGLIVANQCVIKPYDKKRVLVKFLITQDLELRSKIKEILGNEVVFAVYTFSSGDQV